MLSDGLSTHVLCNVTALSIVAQGIVTPWPRTPPRANLRSTSVKQVGENERPSSTGGTSPLSTPGSSFTWWQPEWLSEESVSHWAHGVSAGVRTGVKDLTNSRHWSTIGPTVPAVCTCEIVRHVTLEVILGRLNRTYHATFALLTYRRFAKLHDKTEELRARHEAL